MTKNDTFTFKTAYGAPIPGCRFRTATYAANGNLALQVVNDEGPVCVCTVNPGEKLDGDVLCVKDYSENKGVLDELRRLGVVGETVGTVPCGWVQAEVVRLTDFGKKLFEEGRPDGE